jgi:hypothetical protein
MEPHRDDQLVATLESLRPEPAPEFAAKLDERAAAGFPRRPRGSESPLRQGMARLRATPPRRFLLPAGGIALTAIVVATAVVAASSGGGASYSTDTTSSSMASNEAGVELHDGSGPRLAKPAPAVKAADGALRESSAASASAGSAAASAPTEAEVGSSEYLKAQQDLPGVRVLPQVERLSTNGNHFQASTGPYAAGAHHRDVERAAEITLGTEPSEVGDAAGKVLETVHAYDGIVLNSSVRGGSEGEAGARFELLIPSAKLSDALASFSGIAEVRARHESSNDITAPTVTTGELLQDSHARVESLLNQLADAETEAEQEAVEAKLRAERRHAANLKAQLTALQRRANLSRVSLRIVSDEAPASGAGGGWNAGDALHDAAHILSVAAGVVIVALAVLAPLALIVLLAWLAYRAWLRGRRERALG